MQALDTTRDLLGRLRFSEVSYCHWKSNYSLERSLLGEGDLDLLVDEHDRAKFEQQLRELRFIRLRSTGPKHFDGLEDLLGFDDDSGQLIHLHVHYRLVLGEKRVKNHRLPVERWLLGQTRILGGASVPLAEKELVLLSIRSLLKSDARSCARAWLRRVEHPFPSGILAELEWLADQVDDASVLDACREAGLDVLAPGLEEFLARLRSGRLTPAYVLRRKQALLRELRSYQRFPTIVCVARKVWFRLRYSRPFQSVRAVPKKTLPGRGLYVAVTGADGSGKTTLARDLPDWLGWKVRTSHIYFGQPKDSRIVVMIVRVRKLLRRMAAVVDRTGLRAIASYLDARADSVAAARWLYVARRRVRLDAHARRLAAAGHVVIAERFPLREFWSMEDPMDGPRLQRSSDSRRAVRLANRERQLYERLEVPDLVLVLEASLPTLRQRKPETPLGEHRAKVAAVAHLIESQRHHTIDAERAWDEVRRDARRVVWRALVAMERMNSLETIGPTRQEHHDGDDVSTSIGK